MAQRWVPDPGTVYGNWTVVEQGPDAVFKTRTHARVWCLCKCGKKVLVDVLSLRNGGTTQCLECSHSESTEARSISYSIGVVKKYAITEDGRKCSHCLVWKLWEEFYAHPDTKTGYGSRCKVCCKDLHLRRTYGISLEEYLQKISNQNYKCAVCFSDIGIEEKFPPVDHDHLTGQTRDILCDQCNKGLGIFKDNSKILRQAANYLEKWGN